MRWENSYFLPLGRKQLFSPRKKAGLKYAIFSPQMRWENTSFLTPSMKKCLKAMTLEDIALISITYLPEIYENTK